MKIVVFVIIFVQIFTYLLHYFGIIYIPVIGDYLPVYSPVEQTTSYPANELAVPTPNISDINVPLWCLGVNKSQTSQTDLSLIALSSDECEYQMRSDVSDIINMQDKKLTAPVKEYINGEWVYVTKEVDPYILKYWKIVDDTLVEFEDADIRVNINLRTKYPYGEVSGHTETYRDIISKIVNHYYDVMSPVDEVDESIHWKQEAINRLIMYVENL